MSKNIDFQARLSSIQRIFDIGEYTNAATECVKLSEQALRFSVREFPEDIPEEIKKQFESAVHKLDKWGKGIDGLTMGELVGVMKKSGFLNAWSKTSKNNIDSFQVINLDRLTRLRNRLMHDADEVNPTDAEFLLHCLRVFLETFDITTFEETSPEQSISETNIHETASPIGNQIINISGSTSGSIFQHGNYNTSSIQLEQINLDSAGDVDILKELKAIHETLMQVDTPDSKKIDNAISDAEEELKKSTPDKDEVGQALDRALNYAKKAENFTGVIEKLKPHIINAATWLGSNWHKILGFVGLG